MSAKIVNEVEETTKVIDPDGKDRYHQLVLSIIHDWRKLKLRLSNAKKSEKAMRNRLYRRDKS